MKLVVFRKLTSGVSEMFPSGMLKSAGRMAGAGTKSRQLSGVEVTRIQEDGHEKSRRRQEKLSGANVKGGGLGLR